MTDCYRFTAQIEPGDRGGAYVLIPFDVETVFGQKRPKVVATFDGEPYRGSLVRMGGPQHMLLIRKAIREKLGKHVGDTVTVTVRVDEAPRRVSIPEDLRRALAVEPDAQAFFEALAYTYQREYVEWVTAAKRPTTRRRRIDRTLGCLREGRRTR